MIRITKQGSRFVANDGSADIAFCACDVRGGCVWLTDCQYSELDVIDGAFRAALDYHLRHGVENYAAGTQEVLAVCKQLEYTLQKEGQPSSIEHFFITCKNCKL